MKKRKIAKERNGMDEAIKLIQEHSIIYTIIYSDRTMYRFDININGKIVGYIGAILFTCEDQELEFDKIMHNAIVYFTHWVKYEKK